MKKIFMIFISFIFMMSINAIEVDINSDYAFVYNVKENKIMSELDSNKQISVASLTKIMTAIIVIENTDLDEEVTIVDSDLRDMYVYATAGFTPGDKVTVKDLLYGVLLPSGSDAVNAVVRATSSSEEDFVKLMNDKVKELGLNNTNFSNPIGKDDDNYSTMSDIAKILEYALDNDIFKKIFTTPIYSVNTLTLKGPLSKFKFNMVSGAKTGFTYAAMYCFASFSEKENFEYIVVTAHADSYKDVMQDHEKIYNYYFDNYNYRDYHVNFDIKIKNGKEDFYNVKVNEKLYLNKEIKDSDITYKYEGIKEINKDIKKDDKLGIVTIYNKDELLKTIDVYLEKELEYKNYIWLIIPAGIIFILLLTFKKIKRKKR